jgi:hypothetical protein
MSWRLHEHVHELAPACAPDVLLMSVLRPRGYPRSVCVCLRLPRSVSMGPVDARLAEINERECERVALTFTENRYRYKV